MQSAQTIDLPLGTVGFPSWEKFGFAVETSVGRDLSEQKKGYLYAGVPWVDEIDKKLREFLEFKEDWDSYGALPIPEEVAHKALDLLLKSDLKNIPQPYVIPAKDGGVNYEWDFNGKFLSVEVRKDHSYYFYFDRSTEESSEGEFQDNNLDSVIKLLDK